MSFQDTWPNANVDDREQGDPPEPGLYTVELTDAAAVTSKTTEKDWVILELRGLQDPIEGHAWKVFQGFGSPQQAGFTKRVCRDLGVDTDQINELGELDDQLKLQVGRYFTVEVKRNGEYLNTYIKGSVSPDSFTLQPAAGEVQANLDAAQQRMAATPANGATTNDDDSPPF